jgi:hypothetical protein
MVDKKFIVCIDYTDGGDSESWSPFYMEMYVTDTHAEAVWLGDYHIAHWMNKILDDDDDGELPDYDYVGGVHIRQEGPVT